MKKLIIYVFISLISLPILASVMSGLDQQTREEVEEYFSYNERKVKNIWQLRLEAVKDDPEISLYVHAYAKAQYPYRYDYGTYLCTTSFKKVQDRVFEPINTECELSE